MSAEPVVEALRLYAGCTDRELDAPGPPTAPVAAWQSAMDALSERQRGEFWLSGRDVRPESPEERRRAEQRELINEGVPYLEECLWRLFNHAEPGVRASVQAVALGLGIERRRLEGKPLPEWVER